MGDVLKDLFIQPDIENTKIAVTFTLPEGCDAVFWEVLYKDRMIVKGGGRSEKGAGKYKRARFEAPIPKCQLWSPASPHLYALKLTIGIGKKKHVITRNFGMRIFGVIGRDIYLNGQKFYVRGYVRGREAHDHPDLQELGPEEFYVKNIRAAKAYGFNLIRFHSRIPPAACFRAADRLGMLLHVEIRKYFGKYQKQRSMMSDEGEIIDENEWQETIMRLRNHPSLMVYCMGNEIRQPGRNPFVSRIAKLTKELDPTRLFLDTCAHGEFDRDYVDIDVQHMSYFYPFGKHYDMFEDTGNWLIYGSCAGGPMICQDKADQPTWRIKRTIQPSRPVLAHEICHYVGLRDLDRLDDKFEHAGAEKPWWFSELKSLVKSKGLERDYPYMYEASKRFQMLNWKLCIEAARRSPLLAGFHFLQVADTDRYENSNGILDCFDERTGVEEREFLKFNEDTVILADLPRRTFFEGETVRIPIVLSHYSPQIRGFADFTFSLKSVKTESVSLQGQIREIFMGTRGLRQICSVDFKMPPVEQPEALVLECRLSAKGQSYLIQNDWNLWVFPDRPGELPPLKCTMDLREVRPQLRYPQIQSAGTLEQPEPLLIVDRFSKPVLDHLRRGGDVLMFYRVPETRDRNTPADREQYYLPATWDRFKGVIWDRGTNCGAFIRGSHAMNGFPHNGFLDLQFQSMVDDCDKIVLDDFPCQIDPIMEGVDKAARDRFDVYTFGLSELQPAWTMRKFGYLFEVRVGSGRLLISGLNFTGINRSQPETCALFESLVRYITSDHYQPKAEVSADDLEKYLLEKGRSPRIRERMMTQFWQLDDEPLESDRYWKEAEAYIRKEEGETQKAHQPPETAEGPS